MEEKDFVTEERTDPLEEFVEESLNSSVEAPLEELLEISEEPQSDVVPANSLPQKTSEGIVIKKAYLIIGVAVALVLMVGGFFFGYFLKDRGDVPAPETQVVYLPADPMKPDPNAKPYGDVQAFPENPTPGSIVMPGYSELRMHAETNLLRSVWINSEGNDCYLRFTLRLSETGEVLYQSGLIAPGMAVEESLLTRSLPHGEYEAEILIEAFTLTDAPAPLNAMKVTAVSLYVL